MEATCSSETSIDFRWTPWRFTPEDGNLYNHLCVNLTILFFYLLIDTGNNTLLFNNWNIARIKYNTDESTLQELYCSAVGYYGNFRIIAELASLGFLYYRIEAWKNEQSLQHLLLPFCPNASC
jgi:hypothetical protein